ncbi:hypothetical protein BKA70DRAFT_1437411 [Coprinopsis sp. MPI-PUGE-AT-0042]|nr:hypothetical protein BKA70DRAFT_1437411 [Coprinopsis sp. MPI-PUGE-AT-0042]
MTTHSTQSSRSPRRSGRAHRPPTKFRDGAYNPFVASAKLQRLKTSSPKAAGISYQLSSPATNGSRSVFSTPTKAKVEGTTPVRNLFSSPYIGNNLASETAQGSLDAPIPPLDEVEVYDSLDGAEGQSGAYPNSDHAVDTASSQVFEDGVGQPDEWAFWPPAPSSDNAPAPVDQTSEFEETSRSEGLRLDESFFRHNTVRIFDPLNLPPSNMSVLLGFASRYPAGVHTMAFLNMFRQCLRCDRIVLADKRREHKCPVPDLSVKYPGSLGTITVDILNGRRPV